MIKTGKTYSLILTPNNNWTGDLLMLSGWNFSKERTCHETSFCKRALAARYRLIMPDMLKSTYATHYFPETRNDYRSFPTLTWVTDTLIPELKKNIRDFFRRYQHHLWYFNRGKRSCTSSPTNSKTVSKNCIAFGRLWSNTKSQRKPDDQYVRFVRRFTVTLENYG